MGNIRTVQWSSSSISAPTIDMMSWGTYARLRGVVDEPVKEKHYCEHCTSTSYDDMRGNCCACGAPREHANKWKEQNNIGQAMAYQFSINGAPASGQLDGMIQWRI